MVIQSVQMIIFYIISHFLTMIKITGMIHLYILIIIIKNDSITFFDYKKTALIQLFRPTNINSSNSFIRFD